MTRIILSIISIVLCTAALSASTYAWYLLSITSGTNTVTTADYSLSVTHVYNTAMSEHGTATMSTGAHADFTLNAGDHTLDLSTTSPVSGFAVLEFSNGTVTKTYYTSVVENGTPLEISFIIDTGVNATVKVYAHWGSPANFSDTGTPFPSGTISFE